MRVRVKVTASGRCRRSIWFRFVEVGMRVKVIAFRRGRRSRWFRFVDVGTRVRVKVTIFGRGRSI